VGVTLEFSRGRGSLDAGPRCICTLLQAVEAQSRMTGWCESCRAATRQLAKGPGESRMSSSFFNIVSPGPISGREFWFSAVFLTKIGPRFLMRSGAQWKRLGFSAFIGA